MVVFIKHQKGEQLLRSSSSSGRLTAETVQSAALPLKRVNHIHGCHGFAASVLGVGHGIADHGLQEDLKDTAGLLVDETRDTLDTSTTSETADSGLCDTCRTRKTRKQPNIASRELGDAKHHNHSILGETHPGCYREEPCDDAWLLPFQDPFLLCRGQT